MRPSTHYFTVLWSHFHHSTANLVVGGPWWKENLVNERKRKKKKEKEKKKASEVKKGNKDQHSTSGFERCTSPPPPFPTQCINTSSPSLFNDSRKKKEMAKEKQKQKQKLYPTSLRSCSRINGVYCFSCGYRKIGLYQFFEVAAHFSLGANVIVVIWKLR